MTHKYTNTKIYLMMILATFFWAGAFIAAKLGVYELSPVLLTFLRMGVAAVLIFPYMKWKMGDKWKIQKSELKHFLLAAVVGMIGYHMFFFTALKYTTASKASMINATNPLMTAVLAGLFMGERLTPKKIAMLFLALFGVSYIILSGDIKTLFGMQFNKGDLIMITGTLMWAIYGILVKRAVKEIPPLKLATYSFIFSALITAPFAAYDFVSSNAISVGAGPYLAVVYMAVFPTVLGYSIQQIAISKIGPSKASLFINLVPIISTILAVLFLNEKIAPYHLIGAALIIVAVIVYNLDRQPAIVTDSSMESTTDFRT